MTKKTYNKYIDLINQKTWKDRDIINFRSLLRHQEHNNQLQIGELPLYNPLKNILSLFRKNAPYFLTKEQSEKGLNWLKKKCFKLNGEIRNSKHNPFTRYTCEFLKNEGIPNFSHWTLEDVINVSSSYFPFYVPVYCLHTKDGKTFTYAVNGQGIVID